jgi:predicted acyltransferase
MLGPEIWIMLAAAIAGIALAAVIVTAVRGRTGEPEDVTLGFLGPSLAAIYLLVLAFALVTAWQTNADARQGVVNEASALRSLEWSSAGLPAGPAATLQRQLDTYLNQVVDHDWPQMRHGKLSETSERMIATMYHSALQANPATNAQSAAQQNVVGQLDALLTARAQRASDVGSRLPAGLLAAVLGTSVVVIAFPFAGGLRQSSMSLTLAGLQAVLVAVGVVVVFQLNLAYAGPLAVGPGPIQTVAQLPLAG